MEGLQWYLQNGGDTLLLVAVDRHAADTPGAWPCRVVGTLAPWEAPACRLPADDAMRVSRLLSEVGVPAHLLGCAYLHTALLLLLEQPDLGRSLTRSLYPRIAARHQTDVRSVERAIRHAVSQTFAHTGGAPYRAVLGRLASTVADRPTNAEFLAQTAQHLRLGA